MNSINNNVSNSDVKTVSSVGSNGQKGEESIFDKALDYAKNFFNDEEDSKESSETKSSQFAEDDSKTVKSLSSSSALDRMYIDSQYKRANEGDTYTLAPLKNEMTMSEKWQKENENAELKQKEKEIQKLKDNIYTLKSQNKTLAKQNAMIIQQAMGTQNQQAAQSTLADQNPTDTATKTTQSQQPLPTHTSIPQDVLEKQQAEMEAMNSADISPKEGAVKSPKENDASPASSKSSMAQSDAVTAPKKV